MLVVKTCIFILRVAGCLIHTLSYLFFYVLMHKRKSDMRKCGYLDGLLLFGSNGLFDFKQAEKCIGRPLSVHIQVLQSTQISLYTIIIRLQKFLLI